MVSHSCAPVALQDQGSSQLTAVHLCVCMRRCVVSRCVQDDVQSVDPIDISLNELELNEVSTACSGHQLWIFGSIAF